MLSQVLCVNKVQRVPGTKYVCMTYICINVFDKKNLFLLYNTPTVSHRLNSLLLGNDGFSRPCSYKEDI